MDVFGLFSGRNVKLKVSPYSSTDKVGELGVLRVREDPLSGQMHPLPVKSTPSKYTKSLIKRPLKPISSRDLLI